MFRPQTKHDQQQDIYSLLVSTHRANSEVSIPYCKLFDACSLNHDELEHVLNALKAAGCIYQARNKDIVLK